MRRVHLHRRGARRKRTAPARQPNRCLDAARASARAIKAGRTSAAAADRTSERTHSARSLQERGSIHRSWSHRMPDKETIKRARADKRAGKSASTQAGEFVKREIDQIRKGE